MVLILVLSMNQRYRKDVPIIFYNELNYNFQSRYNVILFRYQNVAEKSSRNDTAATYTAGNRKNGK